MRYILLPTDLDGWFDILQLVFYRRSQENPGVGMPEFRRTGMDNGLIETVESLGDLGRMVIETAYGDVYDRPGLSLRDRQLVTVGVLTALGRSSQLPQHLRTSLRHGVTEAELAEVILQVAVLAGFPVAMNAMVSLQKAAAGRGED
mgnify:CR=1 FL=1